VDVLGIVTHIFLAIEPFAQLTESQGSTVLHAGVEQSTVLRMGDNLSVEAAYHIIGTRSWRRWSYWSDGGITHTSAIRSGTLTGHAGVQVDAKDLT